MSFQDIKGAHTFKPIELSTGFDVGKALVETKTDHKKYLKNITTYVADQQSKGVFGKKVAKGKTDDEKEQMLEAFNKDAGVCGLNKYVKKATWRMDKKHTTPCQECPKGSIIAKIDEYNTSKTLDKKAAKPKDVKNLLAGPLHHHVPSNIQLVDMCSMKGVPKSINSVGKALVNWFPAQYEANPYMKHEAGYDWPNLKSPRDNNLLKQWVTDRISDKKIDCFILGDTPDSTCDVSGFRGLDPYKDKHSDYDCSEAKGGKCRSADDFKKLISKDRGDVKCSTVLTAYSDIKTWNKQAGPDDQFVCKNKTDTMGDLGYIIPAQYQDWSADYLTGPKDTDKLTFKSMGQPLLPPNPKFEGCINDLLVDYGNDTDYNLKMIHEIKGVKELNGLSAEHIDFIGKKLRMLLVDKMDEGVLTCIRRNIIVDTTICKAGLTEQMMLVLNILFSVIGFNFDMNELYEDTGNKKLMVVIDKLGDIIPKSLEKIIDISEKLEIDTCGSVSDSTKSLKKLHEKLFKDSKNVVSFDLGISKMISDASNQEFNRTTALAFIGIAFLKYF